MELERHRDLAFGTALALLGDYHRAEDAVQEAFVEAIRCWDRLENPEARGAWLRGIVRHRCFRILSAKAPQNGTGTPYRMPGNCR